MRCVHKIGSIFLFLNSTQFPYNYVMFFSISVTEECIFTSQKCCLHDEAFPNNLKLSDYPGARNKIVCSALDFQNKIFQTTWPIHHVVFAEIYVFSSLNERTCESLYCKHYSATRCKGSMEWDHDEECRTAV